MDMSFSSAWQQITTNPALLVTVLLTLGVIFVNGWTDAPNAIATCVSTRSMGVTAAIVMSAVFNFFWGAGHDDGQCHRGNNHQQHG